VPHFFTTALIVPHTVQLMGQPSLSSLARWAGGFSV